MDILSADDKRWEVVVLDFLVLFAAGRAADGDPLDVTLCRASAGKQNKHSDTNRIIGRSDTFETSL